MPASTVRRRQLPRGRDHRHTAGAVAIPLRGRGRRVTRRGDEGREVRPVHRSDEMEALELLLELGRVAQAAVARAHALGGQGGGGEEQLGLVQPALVALVEGLEAVLHKALARPERRRNLLALQRRPVAHPAIAEPGMRAQCSEVPSSESHTRTHLEETPQETGAGLGNVAQPCGLQGNRHLQLGAELAALHRPVVPEERQQIGVVVQVASLVVPAAGVRILEQGGRQEEGRRVGGGPAGAAHRRPLAGSAMLAAAAGARTHAVAAVEVVVQVRADVVGHCSGGQRGKQAVAHGAVAHREAAGAQGSVGGVREGEGAAGWTRESGQAGGGAGSAGGGRAAEGSASERWRAVAGGGAGQRVAAAVAVVQVWPSPLSPLP